MPATILIADDHPLFRDALRSALARAVPDARVHEADSVASLLELVEAQPDADLLLLDLNMPGAQGLSALVHLRGNVPALPVVVVSAQAEPQVVRRALAHGASGFVSKSADVGAIGEAITTVLAGQRYVPFDAAAPHAIEADERLVAERVSELTPQQFRVLGMLASGMFNKQIASALDVSEATIKAHMTAILRKLGASNRTQAVLLAGKLALDPASVSAPAPEND
jgi:DNA-binding NarL/FixJ family response regulator